MGSEIYWSFCDKTFTSDSGRRTDCKGETVLAAFMVWKWHQDEPGPYLAAQMFDEELGLGVRTFGSYRSTLRRRFADAGLHLWEEEETDLARSPLTLAGRLPSDLADLLDAHRASDVARLRDLVGEGGRWDGLKRALRRRPRGAWARNLIERLDAIEAQQLEERRRAADVAEPEPAEPPRAERLFGRERERERIAAGLAAGKAVVLHGAARLGKTALAKATAAEFSGRVLWIALAGAQRQEIASAITAQLDAEQRGGIEEIMALLRARLQTYGKTLLVLDDVLGRSRIVLDLVNRLHALCAEGLQIVVTSHIRLGLDESVECAIPVATLPRGDPGTLDDPGTALFEATAKELAGIEFDASRRALISELCEAQRRHPLRIKLAVGLLRQGRTLAELRDFAARNADLEAAIQHAFDSLPARQRGVLARLSVFGGAFDMHTAATVIEEDPDDLMAAVESLIGTFVVDDPCDAERIRFRLEDSIRAPAEARLRAAGQEVTCRMRLLEDLLTRLSHEPRTSRAAWLDRVAEESEGAMAFLETMLLSAAAATDERVLELVIELVPYWVGHGLYQHGRRMLVAAQKKLGPAISDPTRAGVLNGQGLLAWVQGDRTTARKAFEQASKIQGGGDARLAEAALGLGLVDDDRSQLERARNQAARASAVYADACVALGWQAYHLSDYERALSLLEDGASSATEAREERSAGDALIGTGWVRRRLCDFTGAADDFEDALAHGRELKDRTLIAQALNAKGELARAYGDHAAAWRELDEAKRLVDLGAASVVRARVLGSRGELMRASATSRRELREARTQLEESLELVRDKIPTQEAWRHFGLGLVTFMLGTAGSAKQHFEDSKRLAEQHGDRWQEARSRHQLARLELAAGDPRTAVSELLGAARTQMRLGVLDDLGWTLQDLAHAAHRLGRDELAATLTGARMGIERRRLDRQPRRILRSAPLDAYAKELEAACAASHAALGDAWDDAFEAGDGYVTRSFERIRLGDELLLQVESELLGGADADGEAAA